MNTAIRWARIGAVLALALVLQLTIFTDVRVAGVAPELLALVAVGAGLVAGPDRGPLIAFMAGLLWDVYLPTPLGVAALAFALAAFSIASIEGSLYGESRLQLMLLVGIASALTVVAYAFVGALVAQPGLVSVSLFKVAAIAGVVNGFLAPLALPLIRWACEGRRGALVS